MSTPGKRAYRILDVAQRAGVSPATVSRVLSGKAAVTEETQARVLAAIQDLGFRPNHVAQALRRGHGNTVALLVGDIEQGVYASLTKHVQAALEEVGLDLLLYNLGHSRQRLENILARTDAMRLSGLVIAASDILDGETVDALLDKAAQGLPVVAVGLWLQDHCIPSVVYDDAEAIRRSVDYLIRSHGGPVAYVGRIAGSASGTERYRGYLAALADHGLDVDPALVWDSAYRYKAGFESAAKALAAGLRFRAVQAGSDEVALGAMSAIMQAGLRIPDEVAVAGIGDIEASAYLSPTLTTHGAAPDRVAAVLVELFSAARAGVPLPPLTTLVRPFIRRASA